MVVSSDEDYGSDPGLQSPETPDIRASMTKAAQFSLHRAQRASIKVRGSPVTYQVLTASLHRCQGHVGPRKWPEIFRESVVLSGKRTRTATVTFVAESVGLIKQEHRRIVLPRS